MPFVKFVSGWDPQRAGTLNITDTNNFSTMEFCSSQIFVEPSTSGEYLLIRKMSHFYNNAQNFL